MSKWTPRPRQLADAATDLYEALWKILGEQSPLRMDLWKVGYDAILKAHGGDESAIEERELADRARDRARARGEQVSGEPISGMPASSSPKTEGEG